MTVWVTRFGDLLIVSFLFLAYTTGQDSYQTLPIIFSWIWIVSIPLVLLIGGYVLENEPEKFISNENKKSIGWYSKTISRILSVSWFVLLVLNGLMVTATFYLIGVMLLLTVGRSYSKKIKEINNVN